MVTIRPYTPADKPALLALFDQNTPPYFAPHERDALSDFLDEPQGEYLIIENKLTYPFFQKFGFEITAIQENGFGPGLDIYSMVLDLIKDSK